MAYENWSPVFRLWSNVGAYIGEVRDVKAASWSYNLNGEDTVTLSTTEAVAKLDRLLWCDWRGTWHEQIADEPNVSRRDGVPVYTVVFRSALNDLDGCHIPELMEPRNKTAEQALGQLLAGTGWQVGDCTGLGTASMSAYRINVLEAVRKCAEAWDGDLRAVVEVGDTGVTARKVALARMGRDAGRRFEYGRDLIGVERFEAAGPVYTAMYGYGKGEEVGNGFGRRITFEGVEAPDKPKGQAWVGDDEARASWGILGPDGAMRHREGFVTFAECEDPSELLSLTRDRLQETKRPRVGYKLDVLATSAAGLDSDDVALGDTIQFVDYAFTPMLRGTARISAFKVNLLDISERAVTIGEAVEGISDRLRSVERDYSAISAQTAAWEAVASAAPDYLRDLLFGISMLANAGLSYKVESPELGVLVANVPLDPETGAPDPNAAVPQGGYSCLRLRAGTIQTSSKYENGWVWETAIRGGGIVANAITTGIISDAIGRNSWNLDTGVLQISGVATDSQVEDAMDRAETAIASANSAAASAETAIASANSAAASATSAAAAADDAKRTATNFISLDPSGGVEVGNKTSGSWSGTRTKQAAAGFSVLSQDGTEQTFIGVDVVELAKALKSAIIKLCGGSVEIRGSEYGGMGGYASVHAPYLNMGAMGAEDTYGINVRAYDNTNKNTASIGCSSVTGDITLSSMTYGGAKVSRAVLSPDGLEYSGKALIAGTAAQTVTTGIEFRKHAGVITVSFLGWSPNGTLAPGSSGKIFTLSSGNKPKQRTASMLINDNGVTCIVTVETNGDVYFHARGQAMAGESLVWGQVAFFAEA